MNREALLAALLGAGCAGLPEADLAPWPGGASVAGWPARGARGGRSLAGETFRLDLPTVLRLAGVSPVEVGLVRERIAAAEADRALALESLLPYATLGGAYTRLDGLTQGTDGSLSNVDKQSFHFAARGVLEWDLGRAVFATLAAAQRVDAAREEGEARRREVARDAAEAYLDLSLASAEAEIHRRSLEIAERLRSQVEAAVEAGRGFRGDVLRARARAAHHRLGVERAEEKRRTVGVRLATLLRLDPEVTLLPSDARPLPVTLVPEGTPVAALLEKALRERPEILAAGARRAAAARGHDGVVWGPWIPTARAEVWGGRFGYVASRLDPRDDYAVGLWWRVGPGGIFDFGRAARAAADVRAADWLEAGWRERVAGDVLAAAAETESRRRQVAVAAEEVRDAEEALRLHEERERLGVSVPLEVIQAEEALTRARLDEAAAAASFTRAQIRLWVASGTSLADVPAAAARRG